MKGFIIKTKRNGVVRFKYDPDAPLTCAAFDRLSPFTLNFIHARLSGEEIWTDDAPKLDIIQENASVFAQPGEVVIGPLKPARVKTSGLMGIYYGEGRGVDSCNIFAKVFDEDTEALKKLGDAIWKQGAQEITFEKMDQ